MEVMRETPEVYTSELVVVRLIDALHYRYARALEGLEAADATLGLGNDTMNIAQLNDHIQETIQWVRDNMVTSLSVEPAASNDALDMLDEMRAHLMSGEVKLEDLSISGKSFWHAISGPLADALTHVGQINIIKSSQKGQRTRGKYFS